MGSGPLKDPFVHEYVTLQGENASASNDDTEIAATNLAGVEIVTVARNKLRFLSLPAEIRHMIYRLLLYSGLTLSRTPSINGYRKVYEQPFDKIHTAVLRVNRLISSEALAIFYSVNNFRFPAALSDQFWSRPNQRSWPIAIIPASSQAFLRRVFVACEVVDGGSNNDQAWNLAELTKRIAASNLRLETFTVKFWGPDRDRFERNGPETKESAVLRKANRLGFSDARKRLADEKGTLSTLMGHSKYPGGTSHLIERPIRKSGTSYTLRPATGTHFDADYPDYRLRR